MGIRLSLRKKNIQSEEFCLGKLFSYLDKSEDANGISCIWYLVNVGAINGLLEEFSDEFTGYLSDTSKAERFELICEWCSYQDYGEFFELTKDLAREFIKMYINDKSVFWNWNDKETIEFENEALAFMDRQSSLETSIFEFRLGA